MHSLEEALEHVLSRVAPLDSEEAPLRSASARFIAADARSSVDLPGFDNSAMDGYAVDSSDLKNASEVDPVELKNVGEIPAGTASGPVVEKGLCARIFTGSPLPSGADSVVMQEDTRPGSDPGWIEVLDTVRPWENVRFAGEDVKKNSVILSRGERIRSGGIALLAACGHKAVRVGRQPGVGLLATGSELVEPGHPLLPGQIYESNRALLGHLVERAGGVPDLRPIVVDDFDRTCEALKLGFEMNDVVITSGGVSVGDHDYVKPAIEKLGGTVELWRVSVRPGKPFVYGQVNGKHFFGLPGNPISAFVTFLLFVRPALIKMQGGSDVALPVSHGVLAEEMVNRGNRRHFARVVLGGDGRVVSAGMQASHALSSLASANGLLDVPPGTTWEAGRSVGVLRVDE